MQNLTGHWTLHERIETWFKFSLTETSFALSIASWDWQWYPLTFRCFSLLLLSLSSIPPPPFLPGIAFDNHISSNTIHAFSGGISLSKEAYHLVLTSNKVCLPLLHLLSTSLYLFSTLFLTFSILLLPLSYSFIDGMLIVHRGVHGRRRFMDRRSPVHFRLLHC